MELICICGINAGFFAPVRKRRKSISGLKSEEHSQQSKDRNKDDISFACDLADAVSVLGEDDTEDEEKRRVVPPLALEPVAAGEVVAVSEKEASDYHRYDKDTHNGSRCGAVPDKAVHEEEY